MPLLVCINPKSFWQDCFVEEDGLVSLVQLACNLWCWDLLSPVLWHRDKIKGNPSLKEREGGREGCVPVKDWWDWQLWTLVLVERLEGKCCLSSMPSTVSLEPKLPPASAASCGDANCMNFSQASEFSLYLFFLVLYSKWMLKSRLKG